MEQNTGHTEYAKDRMIGYARLLKEIAADCGAGERCVSGATREELINQRERQERRSAFSYFVMDASGQLEELAGSRESDTVIARKQERLIRKQLHSGGIELKDFCRRENRNGYQEIRMTARARGGAFYDVEEVGELLSRITHRKMLPLQSGCRYIHDEFIPVCFQEEVNFKVFGGFARATKEGEEISGDNMLMREYGDGTYLAGIADGMGSGSAACEDSEKVLSLIERHIETGLSVKSALHISGELLHIRHEGERSVSLDLLELNQYTGACQLYKNGAPSSFLKRKNHVRELAADRLPLGISPQIEGSSETIYLQSQDIMILVSDGVLEVFYDNMELFLSRLEMLDEMTPPEIAAAILRFAIQAGGGIVSDDMTVLVIGVCEKEDEPVAF